MKQHFTIIILCLASLISQAQSKKLDLSDYERINSKTKFELMEKVKNEFPFYSESENWPNDYTQYFHFIDLDNDYDFDLIYDGWSGSEPMMVNIYINKSGIFELLLKRYTIIKGIEIEENCLKKIEIHNPGCCAAIMEHFYAYKFESKPDNIDYWLVDHITWHNETSKPKKTFKNNIEFRILKPQYTLRITPEIDKEGYFYPGDVKGNKLKMYTIGNIGFASAEKTDTTGRIWWYVTMNNLEKRNKNIKDPDVFPPKHVGWMSSRYLEIIK